MAFGTRNLAVRRALRIVATLFLLAMAIRLQPVVRAAPIVVETRVMASSDDAEEFPTGAVSLTSGDLELVLEPNRGNQIVGIRFPAIAIPNGATLTSAYIQFRVDEASSEETSLTIAAEASDTAPTFTTATGNVSGRPRTAASVTWNPPAWPTVGAVGPDQRTPNLASVIQAVISRPGWNSGNALALIVTGSGHRVASAWDGSVTGAPLLHIEYQAGAVTTPPTVSSFSPASGFTGDTVSISGNHFLGATGVSFNGAPASFAVISDTQITATVPAGVSSGPISVTNDAGTGVSGSSFTVQAPSAIRVPADYSTVQAAINAAPNGGTIIVSPGTYTEQLLIQNKRITLASSYFTTGDSTQIDATVLQSNGNYSGITILSTAAGTSVIGFKLLNTVAAKFDGLRIEATAQVLHNHIVGYDDAIDFQALPTTPSSCTCSFNVIENSTDDAIDFDGAAEGTIEGNVILNSRDDGYETRMGDYSGALNIVMRNNVIRGSNGDGIQLIDEAGASNRRYRIEGNDFISNRKAGIGLLDSGATTEDYRASSLIDQIDVINNTFSGNDYGISGGDNLVAVNNLFVGSKTLGLKNVDGGSTVAYNLFWGNATNFTGSNIDTNTTLIADPLLNADLTLRSGSPAIDAGTASFQWRGTSVINLPPGSYSGSAPDLGAHESGGTGNLPTATPTRTSTASATASATTTNSPTATATSTPSATHTPTASNTPPATNTPTGTQVNTVTPTPTNSTTATSTATPTATSTSTATSTPVPTATSSGGTGTLTFSTEADARVDAAAANSNFGVVTSLPVDSSPQQESFLRFTVSGVGGPITSARLRLFVTNGTTNGPPIFLTGNSWSEAGITWNTKPARIGSGVDDKANIAASAWVEYNVTSLVGGNGTYSFNFLPQSSDAVTFNSREAGSNQPQLIVSFSGSGPTATPSATATTPPTVTATPSPTATFTSTPTASAQPTDTPTETNAPSETPVPTATDMAAATATATDTPIVTATVAPTDTPTDTPVPTATATATPTNTVAPTPTTTATPESGPLFTDGFESGNLAAWRTIKGLIVQPDLVRTGSYAARGTSTTAATYARVQLTAPQTELYFRTFINIQSQSSATVYFIRFRNAGDASFLGVYSNSSGRIGYRNDLSGLSTTTTTTISKGVWHEVELHAIVNGAGGLVEIWLDGVLVVSKAENLGANPTQIIQIGENGTGSRSYDIAFDDVIASTTFIAPTGAAPAAQARIANTATPTMTPEPTATATPTLTATPMPTETPALTATESPTPEPAPSEELTAIPTPEAVTNEASPTP